MVLLKKIGLDRNEYNSATAAWCIGQYAGLRRKWSGFDAALGFDFIHLYLFRDGVEGW